MTDERIETSCENCGEALMQMEGDWHCPECDDLTEFIHDDPEYDFIV